MWGCLGFRVENIPETYEEKSTRGEGYVSDPGHISSCYVHVFFVCARTGAWGGSGGGVPFSKRHQGPLQLLQSVFDVEKFLDLNS